MFRGISAFALSLVVSHVAVAATPAADCAKILTLENYNPRAERVVDPTYEDWESLRDPLLTSRPRGLKAIREAIARDGLVTVIDAPRPKREATVRALEFLYGTKLVFVGDIDPSAPAKHGRGVALHPDNTPRLANAYRADINPHMGFGRLHGAMNKWNEYVFAEHVRPGVMPKTLRAIDLADAVASRDARQAMFKRLEKRRATREDIETWTKEVERFFAAVARAFPEGAFIKHVGEFATKDKNGQILSWKADPREIVKKGFEKIAKIRANHPKSALNSREVQEAINVARGAEARFMNAFLREPQSLMAQAKLDIMLTDFGKPMEIRVDFADGEAVRALPRHSFEYYPEQEAQAMRFLNEFFAAAPEKYRYLSGGADVMFLKDGSMRFIEFNVGAQSEFIDAGAGYPVLPNIYIAGLTGQPTPLLRELQEIAQRPIEEQIEFLKRLDHLMGVSKWGDYSVASYEAIHYIRDLRLAEWSKNPTAEGAATLTRELTQIVEAVAPDPDAQEPRWYVEHMQPYLQRKMVKNSK